PSLDARGAGLRSRHAISSSTRRCRVRRLLLAAELEAGDPGASSLVAAFRRELPRWDVALLSDPGSAPARPAWQSAPATVHPRAPLPLIEALRGSEAVVLGDDALRGRAETRRQALHVAALAKALG